MNKRFVPARKAWELFQPFRKQIGVVLVLLASIQVISLLSPYLFGKVLNAIQEHQQPDDIIMLIGLTFLMWVFHVRLHHMKDIYELRRVDFLVWSHLTEETMSKILGLSIGQHRSQNSGITHSVISKGQSSLEQMTFLLLYTILPVLVYVLITVVLLLSFNLQAGMIVFAGTAGYCWLTLRNNRRFWPGIKSNLDLGHKNSKFYTEILRNTPLVQTNSQEKRVQGEQNERNQELVKSSQDIWIPFNIAAWNKHLLIILTRFAVLSLGAYLVYKHNYRYGDFVITWLWANQATGEIGNIGRLQREWLRLWGEARKYFAILDVEPAIKIDRNPVRIEKLEGRVEFRNVSFTYPNQRYVEVDDDEGQEEQKKRLPALVDVSFKIEPGERVAFVGESGAGKSTIVNLLLRGYDPDTGEIRVDDCDLRLVDLQLFRRQVGLVEQNVVLFDNTLRYNTLFGLNGQAASVTEMDLERVSHEARIDGFSHRLTNGWDTPIGENGLKLSGGERQRVGIARALIKNSRILILDEATSNIDAKNERLIKEAVHNASIGRTTIIIAHRLSTVRDVDKIFVMDKGKIVDEGRHEILCETCGIYRELVESQLVPL
ncbi:ABC transporter ATP-binding protein/permease [Candidatus Parcubacteria bacterium]|nr:ABC transporter ATP-binding protein/permease [Candidatus Parcubacteria bacterium]